MVAFGSATKIREDQLRFQKSLHVEVMKLSTFLANERMAHVPWKKAPGQMADMEIRNAPANLKKLLNLKAVNV